MTTQAIIEEARNEINRLPWSDTRGPADYDKELDRIITTAVERAMASGASLSAIEVCKTILHFEQFGGIPTVARLVDAYAAAAVERACEPLRRGMLTTLAGCQHCEYDEAEGGLYRHCDACLENIARTAWELFVTPPTASPILSDDKECGALHSDESIRKEA